MKKIISFDELQAEWMKDPEYVKEYNKLEEEYKLIEESIKRRIERKLSQKKLAEKIKTKQSAIARLESGKSNPSIKFLKKVAKALDCKLEIKFVPITN